MTTFGLTAPTVLGSNRKTCLSPFSRTVDSNPQLSAGTLPLSWFSGVNLRVLGLHIFFVPQKLQRRFPHRTQTFCAADRALILKSLNPLITFGSFSGVDMVVSGVPQENGILHASEIASMALDLVGVCRTFRIPHKPSMQLQIRAGIHSGTGRPADPQNPAERGCGGGVRLTASPVLLRAGGGRSGGDQDAAVLSVRGHGEHGVPHGVHQHR